MMYLNHQHLENGLCIINILLYIHTSTYFKTERESIHLYKITLYKNVQYYEQHKSERSSRWLLVNYILVENRLMSYLACSLRNFMKAF